MASFNRATDCTGYCDSSLQPAVWVYVDGVRREFAGDMLGSDGLYVASKSYELLGQELSIRIDAPSETTVNIRIQVYGTP